MRTQRGQVARDDDVELAVQCFQAQQVITSVHEYRESGMRLRAYVDGVFQSLPVIARTEAIDRVFPLR
jgi:phage terminase small subunit